MEIHRPTICSCDASPETQTMSDWLLIKRVNCYPVRIGYTAIPIVFDVYTVTDYWPWTTWLGENYGKLDKLSYQNWLTDFPYSSQGQCHGFHGANLWEDEVALSNIACDAKLVPKRKLLLTWLNPSNREMLWFLIGFHRINRTVVKVGIHEH